MLSPSNPFQVTRRRRAGGLLLDHPRHAWVHTSGSTMDGQSAYDILGIDSSVSLDEIKSTYRSLAKKYHPDKNSSNGSTALFQRLNQAYQTLLKCHISAGHDGDSPHVGPVCVDSISDITLHTKENTFSVTIDITDIMFLVILSECESHHDVSPIDRGINGQQLRFPYTSPGESEHYGSISLTFYPTTSRLLVQGSSYLLWVDEHLPTICKQAELKYMQHASTWTASSRRRGIGLKREGHLTRHSRSMRSSRSDDISNPTDLAHTSPIHISHPGDLAHTSVLLDVSGTSPATPSPVQAGDTPLLLPASGIEPTAESVQLSCDAEDTTSVADSSPIKRTLYTQENRLKSKHRRHLKRSNVPKRKQPWKRRKKLWSLTYRIFTATRNVKSPNPPTWFAAHYVWRGFMSNALVKTLTTRVSGVVTCAVHCPNLYRVWLNKLNALSHQ